MKIIKYILFISLLLLASCDKAFENGELDGMWRLEKVEVSGKEIYPSDVYYSFQRHLVMLGVYSEQAPPLLYMANFDYSAGKIVMNNFYAHPGIEGECNLSELEKYYIYNATETFMVDVLNADVLLMHTADGRIYNFRKW